MRCEINFYKQAKLIVQVRFLKAFFSIFFKWFDYVLILDLF